MAETVDKKPTRHVTQRIFWTCFSIGAAFALLIRISVTVPTVEQAVQPPPVDPGPVMVFMRLVETYELVLRRCEKLTENDLAPGSVDSTRNLLDAQKNFVRSVSLRGVNDPAFSRVLGDARGTMLAEWNRIAGQIDDLVEKQPNGVAANHFHQSYLNVAVALRRAANSLGLGEREAESIVRKYLEFCREERDPSAQQDEKTPLEANETDSQPETEEAELSPADKHRVQRLLRVVKAIVGPETEATTSTTMYKR